MYKSILVAVDDSDQSTRAVEAGIELARQSGGSIHLFHVRERQDVIGKGGGSFDNEYKEEAEALVAKYSTQVGSAGVVVTTEVSHAQLGHVAQEVIRAADDNGCDTIVMGSQGRSGIGAILLGSNAYKVLHLADRPVLIIR